MSKNNQAKIVLLIILLFLLSALMHSSPSEKYLINDASLWGDRLSAIKYIHFSIDDGNYFLEDLTANN